MNFLGQNFTQNLSLDPRKPKLLEESNNNRNTISGKWFNF